MSLLPPPPSATYERLREFIAERMRMSHIYQPLMLMELLSRRSPAPAQEVARRILGEDVTQIDYYTERVKRMVGKVLTGNGITAYGNGAYSLIGGDELSDAERDALQQLCRQRLDAFREQRGEEVFAHRSRHRARGGCECCGAHEHQRALEVDHIIPKTRVLLENELALCIADTYPVSEGHSLVIPRRHGADGLELHQPEWNAVVEQLSAQDATISGWAGLLNARGGAELRRGGGAVGVSCALASESPGEQVMTNPPAEAFVGVIKRKQHY